jgi:hypothetical protein
MKKNKKAAYVATVLIVYMIFKIIVTFTVASKNCTLPEDLRDTLLSVAFVEKEDDSIS